MVQSKDCIEVELESKVVCHMLLVACPDVNRCQDTVIDEEVNKKLSKLLRGSKSVDCLLYSVLCFILISKEA